MKALLAVSLVAALGVPLGATSVQIIANPGVGVAEVTASDLRDIFLGSKTTVGGGTVEPVYSQNGEAHEYFLKTYLGKSESALRNHFKTLVFTGKGVQPRTFGSDAEIVKYVTTTKGAIGYVNASADIGSAKKIQVK